MGRITAAAMLVFFGAVTLWQGWGIWQLWASPTVACQATTLFGTVAGNPQCTAINNSLFDARLSFDVTLTCRRGTGISHVRTGWVRPGEVASAIASNFKTDLPDLNACFGFEVTNAAIDARDPRPKIHQLLTSWREAGGVRRRIALWLGPVNGVEINSSDGTLRSDTYSAEFTPFLKPGGTVTQGLCHTGYCPWSKWLSVEILEETSRTTQLEVRLLGGSSEHAENYPQSPEGVNITWDEKPHTVVVSCSYSRPAVMTGDQKDILMLNPEGHSPWMLLGTQDFYFEACHSYFGGPGKGIEKYDYHVSQSDGNTA